MELTANDEIGVEEIEIGDDMSDEIGVDTNDEIGVEETEIGEAISDETGVGTNDEILGLPKVDKLDRSMLLKEPCVASAPETGFLSSSRFSFLSFFVVLIAFSSEEIALSNLGPSSAYPVRLCSKQPANQQIAAPHKQNALLAKLVCCHVVERDS